MRIKSGSGFTIENYLLSSTAIPIVGNRNRDRTPIIGEFNMTVSENQTSGRTIGQTVEVTLGSNTNYPSFIGTIVGSGKNEDQRTYKLSVRSLLADLETRIVSNAELHGVISAGATTQQYNPSDNNGRPSVQVVWVIEKMFDQLGINFNFTNSFKNKVMGTISFGGTLFTMQMKHLRMDENMMYAINQPYAAPHTLWSDAEYVNNRFSFWDFVSHFCSYVDAKITLSTTGDPRQLIMGLIFDDTTGLNLDDDDIYSRKKNYFFAKQGGYSMDHQWSENREHYYSGTNTITSHLLTEGKAYSAIPTVNNMVFIYEKHAEMIGGGEGYTFAIDDEDFLYSKELFLVNKRRAIMSDWEQTKYKTNIALQTNARINKVNVKEQTLSIIDEDIA